MTHLLLVWVSHFSFSRFRESVDAEGQSSRRAICNSRKILGCNSKEYQMLRVMLIARSGPRGGAKLSWIRYGYLGRLRIRQNHSVLAVSS